MHFAALKDVPSGMRFRNPHVGMGGTDLDREYRNTLTDGAPLRRRSRPRAPDDDFAKARLTG